MKITKIETLLISEKLKDPWVMGLGTANKRDELIVRLHTDEGITGIGSSYPFAGRHQPDVGDSTTLGQHGAQPVAIVGPVTQ